MFYYKFIDEEHHPVRGQGTIRLGTFNYYKQMETDNPISDSEEGRLHYEVNALYQGSDAMSRIPGLNQIISGEGTLQFVDCTVVVPFPNCLLFCCSAFQIEPNHEELLNLAIKLGKRSYYKIENINKFSSLLLRSIIESMKVSDLSHPFGKNWTIAEINNLQIGFLQKAIQYGDKHVVIGSSDEDNSGLEKQIEHVFKKSLKYQDDREHRIVFFINSQAHQNALININCDYLDLELNPYKQLII